MRSTFKTVLVAMLAVFALSAVAASAAQAEEAPFFKVAGARLAKGESKELVGKAGEVAITLTSPAMQCSLTVASGAKLLGSNLGNPGTGEMAVELSNCSIQQEGCEVLNQPVKSSPLVATLVLQEKTKGSLVLWLKPKTGSTFIKLKLGAHCAYGSEGSLSGSVAAEVYSGGKPVEVGKESAEAKTLELNFPTRRIEYVWDIGSGLGEKENVELSGFTGGSVEMATSSTRPLFELTSGQNWGAFD